MSNIQNQRSDQDLVQNVRNGDRHAFTELMHRYQERVYWVVRRIVGNHDDADEVTQEAFVKAYVGLGEFRGDASFYTWLYRIAVNLSLNTIRKRQVLNYLRDSAMLSRLFPLGEDPVREVEFRDLQSRLEKAVTQLPEKQRAVFVLRHYEGMPYEEISQVLKTSVGGLKANYFHALKKVRQFLRDEALDGDTVD